MEEWRYIENTDKRYAVSNYGRVKSFDMVLPCGQGRTHRRAGKILQQHVSNRGYLIVEVNGKSCLVHRLVAMAFLDNPQQYDRINHKDENRKNNRVENLEWCSAHYNSHYGTRIEKLRVLNERKAKKVAQIFKDGTVKEWRSFHDIERALGYSRANISRCCNKVYKTAYGCVWRYIEDVTV